MSEAITFFKILKITFNTVGENTVVPTYNKPNYLSVY